MQASLSSSFSCYSNTTLTEIAARVVEEFMAETETEPEFFFNYDDDDDDFEFAFVTTGSDNFSPISADEIFDNGQIRPIFNKNLLLDDVEFKYKTSCNSEKVSTPQKLIRVPLRKLFIEDREFTTSSCSSSEADDLEGIPPGTYCVWRPKAVEESPTDERCKKSNSTGSSSKRWKLRDFLYRSNSDGKKTFVYLTKKEEKAEKTRTDDSVKINGKVNGVPVGKGNGGDKRKSYLPYRRDLIGFFGNVNGLNRNLQYF
ncbi:uncharacterized protein LOC132053969 [Lycium ferocissimum]|uniref:uncharacterized protein LOC132053969 n=1 Tax=Lycium ferocissimum TaxID=112874 RepID=UPI0028159210|nr:uncharacterized protein LOC132053969 [Lycium ferocissimum]